jgi:NADH-quinone oxidoreductase subunit J
MVLANLSSLIPLAQGVIGPVAILVLCVVAGLGTLMLLPGRAEAGVRKLGGVVLLTAFLVLAALLVRQASQTLGDLYFWLFSGIALVASVRVVTHRRPVYSALYFVLTVFASAGLFILLWAEFMAAALVLIYAGAILVTYVFVIMLAAQAQAEGNVDQDPASECDRVSREPLVATAVGFAMMGVLLLLIFDKAQSLPRPAGTLEGTSVRDLATYLFESQLVTLELAGIILTLGVVGAILIARRQVASESGVQDVFLAAPTLPLAESDPHTIPIYGTRDAQVKAHPER